ncbi:polysaccharide biosynthesis tyrosine autokinase [Roseofilum sp. BLCC_M91]|uniref:Polysaccharide biosynthesis tyrosine autokinase n=1 Tax=Roseofilum halophilum BLCC-M91 TaxID=3022259 RepID=A0ABT7BN55_9CYAN|nr:polysaccharide biosynthesis tyrosine autokinase [Roseofilum halophilum]MDJ1180595.1 polysaccharide biosynthesis tyrosine autokinase [Roseofilum halophilum BLCC-M91]
MNFNHSEYTDSYNSKKIPDYINGSSAKPMENQENSELNFNWVLAVFRRRLPIMAVVAFGVTALAGSLIVKQSRQVVPVYEGSFRLLVEPVTAESRVARLSLLSQNTEDVVQQGRFNISLVDYESLIRVLSSPQIINPLLQKINEKYPNMTYNGLLGKLSTKRVTYEKDAKTEGTSLIRVSYQSSEPEKIEFVLDILSQGYIDYSIQERKASIQQGIAFIQSELPEQRNRVNSLQDKIQSLRQKYDIIEPISQGQQLSIRQRGLEIERLNVESSLREKKVLYESIQKQFDNGNYVFILSNSPNTYQTILKNAQQVESDIATLSSQLKEDSIPMQTLREQNLELTLRLREQAQAVVFQVGNEVQALEAKLQTLVSGENTLKEEIEIWPLATRQYDELQRELEFAIEHYKELLSKLESLQIDDAQIQIPWQIIDPPKVMSNAEGKPVSMAVKETRKKLAVLMVVSTLLSIGVGFLVEVLIPVFHTPEEVKSFTKLNLLGVIPLAPSLKKVQTKPIRHYFTSRSTSDFTPLLIQPEYSASFLESFRSLYTNIALMGKNQPIRSLVVSSPSTGDGKSTVSMHLAQTAAAMGKRVLLVDADLRLPQLHQALGLQNQAGLSDTIANYISLNEVIQQSDLEENLFFLSAGQTVPDPIKLLSSQKMQYLMGQLQGFFDLVIYDTPPLVGLADGHLVAARVDGVILVVRLAKTDQSLVKKSLEELTISHARVLGVVANEVKSSDSIAMSANRQYRNSSSSLS